MNIEERIESYIKRGGVSCLICGDYDIDGGNIDIIKGEAYQDVHCLHCDAEWTDRYELKDVQNVHVPPTEIL